jgi:hypothetical protein
MHSENVSNWVEGFEAGFVLESAEPQAAIATAHPSAASAMKGTRLSRLGASFAIVLHTSAAAVVESTIEVYATADNTDVTPLARCYVPGLLNSVHDEVGSPVLMHLYEPQPPCEPRPRLVGCCG